MLTLKNMEFSAINLTAFYVNPIYNSTGNLERRTVPASQCVIPLRICKTGYKRDGIWHGGLPFQSVHTRAVCRICPYCGIWSHIKENTQAYAKSASLPTSSGKARRAGTRTDAIGRSLSATYGRPNFCLYSSYL